MMEAAEMPIACDFGAIAPEERAAHRRLTEALFGAHGAAFALSHAPTTGAASMGDELGGHREGYALAFAPEALEDLARWTARERLCCPFLRFELDVAPGGGPLRLTLTGPAGTRAFLDAELPLSGAAGRSA